MPRTRVRLDVHVDLDPMPGTFHDATSAQECVEQILLDRIFHYNPIVLIGEEPTVTNQNPDQPELEGLDLYPVNFTKDI